MLGAQRLHDQGCFLPNLERNGSTARGEINKTQRYLSRAIDQRLAVMRHPQSVDVRCEVRVRAIGRLREIGVCDHLQAANSGVYETTEVEARNNSVAGLEVHDLRTLIA